MEPHAVPRQITTFEFKLIGFLTLKQFLYLIIATAIAVMLYIGFPIPLVNILLAGFALAGGAAFAFLPINDRPLDVWIRNFINRLLQPSQFYYHKKNDPPDFLRNVYFQTNQQIMDTHLDARQKLNNYMNSKQAAVARVQPVTAPPVQTIQDQPLIIATPISEPVTPIIASTPQVVAASTQTLPVTPIPQETSQNQPFFEGIVKNAKGVPIPNILIYVKDSTGKTLRILKSNNLGVFGTYHALDPAEYNLELKDTNQKYFFDTMKFKAEKSNPDHLVVVSKELI